MTIKPKTSAHVKVIMTKQDKCIFLIEDDDYWKNIILSVNIDIKKEFDS